MSGFFIALALAACGQAHAPAPHQQAARDGWLYNAASETARRFTGDVSIERQTLVFTKGAVLTTRILARREPAEPIAQGGPSFSAAALGAPDVEIELRAVTRHNLEPGAPSLCPNGAAATFVALAYSQRSTQLTLMVFNGDEAPGQSANKSWLCATYAYAAPDGVRTRQGVLL